MKMRSLLNRKAQLAFGSAVLAILALGGISYQGLVVSSESGQWLRHTSEVIEGLQGVLAAMQDVESSYQGFVFTGKESYIEAFRASIASVQRGEAAIQNLTVDNSRQQRQFPALERLTLQETQFGEMVIDLRRNGGLEEAANAIRNGDGQRTMGAYRAVLGEMQEEERRLLVLRTADAKRRFHQVKAVLIFGIISGLLIVGVGGWIMQRYFAARRHAEAAFLDGEERFRILVEGVQDYAIFRLDPHGNVVSWNAGAERIKGYKAEEIIGQNFSRFFLQKDID
jgi:CHASE3 domain sensor protein